MELAFTPLVFATTGGMVAKGNNYFLSMLLSK